MIKAAIINYTRICTNYTLDGIRNCFAIFTVLYENINCNISYYFV